MSHVVHAIVPTEEFVKSLGNIPFRRVRLEWPDAPEHSVLMAISDFMEGLNNPLLVHYDGHYSDGDYPWCEFDYDIEDYDPALGFGMLWNSDVLEEFLERYPSARRVIVWSASPPPPPPGGQKFTHEDGPQRGEFLVFENDRDLVAFKLTFGEEIEQSWIS